MRRKIKFNKPLWAKRGYGGTGRRAGLRILWETVQVRFLLSAPNKQKAMVEPSLFVYVDAVNANLTYGSPVSHGGQPLAKLCFAFPLSRGRKPVIRTNKNAPRRVRFLLVLKVKELIRAHENILLAKDFWEKEQPFYVFTLKTLRVYYK